MDENKQTIPHIERRVDIIEERQNETDRHLAVFEQKVGDSFATLTEKVGKLADMVEIMGDNTNKSIENIYTDINKSKIKQAVMDKEYSFFRKIVYGVIGAVTTIVVGVIVSVAPTVLKIIFKEY